ncbi:MAG TPA: hypothetical protein VMV69_05095 [Pirellulales bacterium]|nr:hypothetical protein [Pirellulales bacterium]
MPKGLCILGMVVAGCLLLLFGLDLALKVPFGRNDVMAMDIGFVISATVLAYMSWTTFRELP